MHAMDQSAPDYLNPSEQRLARELEQKMDGDKTVDQSMLNNSQYGNRSGLVENYMLNSTNR